MSIRAAKKKLKIYEAPFDEPKSIEDTNRVFKLLPTTRIHHFKAGLACFIQVLEELIKWKY